MRACSACLAAVLAAAFGPAPAAAEGDVPAPAAPVLVVPAPEAAQEGASGSDAHFEEAAALYKGIIERQPDNKEVWWELIYGYSDRGMRKPAIEWLERYLERFPDEEKALEELTSLYQDEGDIDGAVRTIRLLLARNPEDEKRTDALVDVLNSDGRRGEAAKVLRGWIARHPEDAKRTDALIDLLNAEKRYGESIDVLREWRSRHPEDRERLGALLDLLGFLKRYEESVRELRAWLERRPDDEKRARELADLLVHLERYGEAEALASARTGGPEKAYWLEFLARVGSYAGDPAKSAKYYRELADLKGEDAVTLKRLGTQAFFAGDHAGAREALAKAASLEPDDHETLYHLAESELALGNKAAGKRRARQALDRTPPGGGPRAERRRLSLERRLTWDASLESRYRALAAKLPKDPEVLTGWIEGLLEHGRHEAAEEPVALLESRFPKRERAARLYRHDAAVERGDWRAAAEALEGLTPADESVRRLLAEAYYHSGRWKDARDALAGLPSGGEDCRSREMRWHVDRRLGSRWGPSFRLYSLPDETTLRTELRGTGRAKRDYIWTARAAQGEYRVKSRDSTRSVGEAEGSLAYHGKFPYQAGILAGASAGARRDSFWPGVFVDYAPPGGARFHGRYSYGRLWNDFAVPVTEGAVADDLRLAAENVIGRVYLQGEYQYNHYRVKGGGGADRYQLLPQVGYILRSGGGLCGAPFLAAGYQFFFDDASGDPAFFTRVPLVRRQRAHCVNLSYGQWWRRGLKGDFYAYGCGDPVRDLGFGDLYGISGRVRWAARPWLHAAVGYEYGRETAIGETGQSHTVTLVLEAPWHGGRD